MKFLERLLNWRTTLVGIIAGIATIVGWPDGKEFADILFQVIGAIASLVLLISKD